MRTDSFSQTLDATRAKGSSPSRAILGRLLDLLAKIAKQDSQRNCAGLI
jgi:hypothetical protein